MVSAGSYYLVVSKKGFQDTKTSIINIKSGTESLNIEVSLLPESSFIVRTKPLFKFIAFVFRMINRCNLFILIFGTLASIVVAIILPTLFNFIILGVYFLFDFIKYLLSRTTLKSFGQVLNKNTKQPVALAIVRLFDANKNCLLTSRATDVGGKFQFLLATGSYYVTCAKEGYKPFMSQPLILAKAGILTWDITLEPER